MTKRRSTGDHLPEDLVIEILSRVPAVSLARFRSTCKRWNALLFKNGKFAKKHFANAPRQSLVTILIDYKVYLVSVNLHGFYNNLAPSVKITSQFSLYSSSSQVDIRSVFSCDGLLLCSTMDNRLVVWNPLSGETKWIQPKNSYKESDYYALGYDSKSSCYKILRMDQFGDDVTLQSQYEIYDLASNSWRLVGVNTHWLIRRRHSRGVSVKGNAYWIACPRHLQYYKPFLLSFDFSAESFQSMPHPADDGSYSGVHLLVSRDEQLCMRGVYGFVEVKSCIWVATEDESTGAMSWTKSLTLLATDLRYSYRSDIGISFLADEENKVLLSCTDTRVSKNIIYISGEDRCVQVDLHGVESQCQLLFSYVPSLVQIQQSI